MTQTPAFELSQSAAVARRSGLPLYACHTENASHKTGPAPDKPLRFDGLVPLILRIRLGLIAQGVLRLNTAFSGRPCDPAASQPKIQTEKSLQNPDIASSIGSGPD